MTPSEFKCLADSEKKILLFEANKVAERIDEVYKKELFKIDDFYIESTVGRSLRSKRVLHTYLPHELHEDYVQYIDAVA